MIDGFKTRASELHRIRTPVETEPSSFGVFRGDQCGSTAAHRIKHQTIDGGAGTNEDLEKRQRLLSGPPVALLRHVVQGRDIENIGRLLQATTHSIRCRGHHGGIEVPGVRSSAVPDDVIMLSRETFGARPAETICPDEMILKAIRAKQIIKEETNVMRRSPVAVNQNRTGAGERRDHRTNPGRDECQPVIDSGPVIVEGETFSSNQSPTGGEGRIQVGQVDGVRGNLRKNIQAVSVMNALELGCDRCTH